LEVVYTEIGLDLSHCCYTKTLLYNDDNDTMAPSQLSQLKAALSSAGLNRKSVSQKDRKAKKGRSQDVERSKKVSKLEEIHSRFNKFDERETKVKHDVGGRKLKGVTGRPTAAKQAGLEQVS
jgi:nucleolar protein 14